CGPREDDAVHAPLVEERDGHGHREIGLPRTGRSDAEDEVRVANRLEIAPLVLALGGHELLRGRPQAHVHEVVGEVRPWIALEETDRCPDVALLDLVSPAGKGQKLAQEARKAGDRFVRSLHEQLASPHRQVDIEGSLEQVEVLVAVAEDGGHPGLGDLEPLHGASNLPSGTASRLGVGPRVFPMDGKDGKDAEILRRDRSRHLENVFQGDLLVEGPSSGRRASSSFRSSSSSARLRGRTFTETCSSWTASTGDGEPVMRSVALVVFGNAITSRSESTPAKMAVRRSMPSAIPPCGGAPRRKARSRKPNLTSASSVPIPRTRKIRSCSLPSWIRMLPLPISNPSMTRS